MTKPKCRYNCGREVTHFCTKCNKYYREKCAQRHDRIVKEDMDSTFCELIDKDKQ